MRNDPYLQQRWRGFRLPPTAAPGNPLWSVGSALFHLLLVAVLVSVTLPGALSDVEERTTVITLLPVGTLGPREHALPALGGGFGGGGGVPVAGSGPAERPAPGRDVDSVIPPPEDDIAVVIGVDAGSGDSIAVSGPLGPRRLLRPDYADGRLWVRVHEAGLGVVGPSETVEVHVARIAAAVKERLQAFIDTMPRDSFAAPRPADWTIEVGEDTWGMDGSWIYLGDFKIPTILLALIPMPQGNIGAAMEEAELLRVRAEILAATNRSDNSEEFRDYIEQTRQRKQAERDLEREERERADRTRARRDTITP